jgi:selenide,water dikinase
MCGVAVDLVLVGGGHAHVQVLRGWRDRPVPGVRLTVVLERPRAVYSGMVPGFVAGDYAAHQLEIDAAALARDAGARVQPSRASYIDPELRLIELEDGSRVAYDVASLDVGSTVRGLDLPGVREHALATRPIHDFVARLDAALAAAGPRPRIAVVGAGISGIELAFTLDARLRGQGRSPELHLVGDSDQLVAEFSARVAGRIGREAAARSLRVHTGARARGAEAGAVLLEGGGATARLACDVVVWSTGAAPLPFPSTSPLARDAAGFTRVRPTLQVVGCDEIFAVGDCASFDDFPWVGKAGVYAVREGPVLAANLRARLTGARLTDYRPQRDFLALVNLGNRRALGTKWGVVFAGRWVWRLKDVIDRRFMDRFPRPAADARAAG